MYALPLCLDNGLESADVKREDECTDDAIRDNTLSSRRLPNGEEERGG